MLPGMWLGDLFYGPPQVDDSPTRLTIRSLTFDPEFVGELTAETRMLVSEVRVKFPATMAADVALICQSVPDENGNAVDAEIDPRKIAELPDYQRERLIILGGGDLRIDLRLGEQPTIFYGDFYREAALQLARTMLAEGRPRIWWKRFTRWVPWLLAAIMTASWAGFLIQYGHTFPLTLAVSGTAFAGASIYVAGLATSHLTRSIAAGWPGHRIRAISRASLRTHRADRHRDLLVGFLVGIPVAMVTAVLTFVLKN